MEISSNRLLENAFSSLKEALRKYSIENKGEVGDKYKFSILNFSHFIELSLKHYLSKIHPLLIYKNPFDKKIREDSETITFRQAIQFLENEEKKVSPHFCKDVDYLIKLRNKIMHSSFEIKETEIDDLLGRLANIFMEMDDAFLKINLKSWLSDSEYEIFDNLKTGYLAKYYEAERNIEDLAVQHASDSDWVCLGCESCGYNMMVPNIESDTGYRCVFCGNEESDEFEFNCTVCGVPCIKGYMHITEDERGDPVFICPHHQN